MLLNDLLVVNGVIQWLNAECERCRQDGKLFRISSGIWRFTGMNAS